MGIDIGIGIDIDIDISINDFGRFEVALGFVVAWEVEFKVLDWNLNVTLTLALPLTPTSVLVLVLASTLALVTLVFECGFGIDIALSFVTLMCGK